MADTSGHVEVVSATEREPNKRGAGKGGGAALLRAGRAWPALPEQF